MREILFRGKSCETGEWHYGAFCHYDDTIDDGKDDCDYIIEKHNGDHFPFRRVLSRTIGQYTGLIDKNGRRIFEGDIVLMPAYGGGKVKAVVYFKDGKFAVDGSNWNFKDLGVGKTKEVVGNIYDDQELMSGEV